MKLLKNLAELLANIDVNAILITHYLQIYAMVHPHQRLNFL